MNVPVIDLYRLKPGSIWRAFITDHFAFWMSCAYLFFEYVRPQAIWRGFDVYPYWARTFIMLAFLGWLVDSKQRLIWTSITTGIFTYLVLVILSSSFAYWPEISWAAFMVYFNWVVVFFVLTQTVTTYRRFFILLLIFLVASFKLSFHGAMVWALRGFSFPEWGLAGPEGFFHNPGELAIQMVVFAPIAFFFARALKPYIKRWQLYFLYLMPITAALTVVGTGTRGGLLALTAQVVASITMSKHRIKTLIVIAAIGLIGFQLLPAEQKARFERSGEDGTSIQRLLYWKHGWQMIKDHPVLGVGFFNFPLYYKKYHSEDIVLEMLQVREEAELSHNIFIQVGTDTGFTGLAVFIGLILVGFWSMRNVRKEAELVGDIFIINITKGMNLALFGYIMAGQFVTVAYYPYFWIHLVFVTAICTFWRNEKEVAPKVSCISGFSS